MLPCVTSILCVSGNVLGRKIIFTVLETQHHVSIHVSCAFILRKHTSFHSVGLFNSVSERCVLLNRSRDKGRSNQRT